MCVPVMIEWVEYSDEEGYPYWYNNYTGESTYDQPDIQPQVITHPSLIDPIILAFDVQSEWETHQDEQGFDYYYNTTTGESTYDKPAGTPSSKCTIC